MPNSVHSGYAVASLQQRCAQILGEGLVQPEVVPPPHGDQVAEPHVGHLVRDDTGAPGPLGPGRAAAEEEAVPQGHASRVLHAAGVEVRDEGLVVLPERISPAELGMVVVEGLAGDPEQIRSLGAEWPREAGPGMQPERDPVVLIEHGHVRPGDQGDQVARQWTGGHDRPHPVVRCRGAVAEDGPASRRPHLQLDPSLEIGLVEAGEPARRRRPGTTWRTGRSGRLPGRPSGTDPRRRARTPSGPRRSACSAAAVRAAGSDRSARPRGRGVHHSATP